MESGGHASGGGVEGRKGRDFQSVKEVLFDVANAVFDPALFVAFTNIAGHGLEAIMSGKVQVTGIEERFLTGGVAHDPDLKIVDHNFLRDAAKELEDSAMAGEKVVNGFGQGEFEVEHPAVTEHHQEEGHTIPEQPRLCAPFS